MRYKIYTKVHSWQDLESKWSLPPSRASLASYALQYDGALRTIKVSIFLTECNMFMPKGGVGLVYIV